MGLFSGIDKTKPRKDANYWRDGHYLALVERVGKVETRVSGDGIAIECRIIRVLGTGLDSPHQPDETVSQLLLDKYDASGGNFVAFLMTAGGLRESDITDESAADVYGDENPLAYTVLEIFCKKGETRGKKVPFVFVNYRRRITAIETDSMLTPDEKERFFPEGLLESLKEMEAAD